MNSKSEHLVDLIFQKFKNYKKKEIFLEKETLRKFILSLIEERSTKEINN